MTWMEEPAALAADARAGRTMQDRYFPKNFFIKQLMVTDQLAYRTSAVNVYEQLALSGELK